MTPEALHRPLASVPPSRSSYWLLCVSLIFHVIFLLLIARPFTRPINTPEQNRQTIKATLVYPKLLPPTQPLTKQQPAARADDIVAPGAAQIKIEKIVPRMGSGATSAIPADIPAPPVHNSSVSFTTSKADREADYPGPSAEEQVQQQLKGFNQQAIADIAAEEAVRYRQQKNTPSLLDKPATSQLSEDEKFRQARQVRANCSNTVSKGIAILSKWTGGNIECTNAPDVGSFIQERIDKKAHLPAQHSSHKP